jgi:hypothetical protein
MFEHIRDYYRFMLCNIPHGNPARSALWEKVNDYFPCRTDWRRVMLETSTGDFFPGVVMREYVDFALVAFLSPTWHPRRPKINLRQVWPADKIHSIA